MILETPKAPCGAGNTVGGPQTCFSPFILGQNGVVVKGDLGRDRVPWSPGLVYKLKNGQTARRAMGPEARQVTQIDILPRDVRVRRKVIHSQSVRSGGGVRGKIVGLTRGARKNLVEVARNAEGLVVLVTLTYPDAFPTDGRLVKKHWAAMRRWLGHRKLGGLWCLEFQKRGAPHLHVFLNGSVDKDQVAQAWYRIVASGDDRHLRAGTRVERLREAHAVAGYAAKYCAKMQQKEVPVEYRDVGRFWGCFGGLKVPVVARVTGDVAEIAPLTRLVRNLDRVRRRDRGLRRVRDNGRFSFTGWDVSPSIIALLERQAQPPPPLISSNPPVVVV